MSAYPPTVPSGPPSPKETRPASLGALVPVGRRASRRLRLEALVTVSSETCFITGLSENISLNGVFVATWSPPPVGELVQVRVQVEHLGLPPVLASGRVVWLRTDEDGEPSGCGVEFVGDDQATRLLLAFLATRLDRTPLIMSF